MYPLSSDPQQETSHTVLPFCITLTAQNVKIIRGIPGFVDALGLNGLPATFIVNQFLSAILWVIHQLQSPYLVGAEQCVVLLTLDNGK